MDDLVKRLREDQPVTQDMVSTMQCELQNEAADRIEELEEKLLSATMDGYDMAKHEYRDRIEELEAKLAKAVESLRVIEDASRLYAGDRESDIENIKYAHECTRRLCVTTIAELKGQNDE